MSCQIRKYKEFFVNKLKLHAFHLIPGLIFFASCGHSSSSSSSSDDTTSSSNAGPSSCLATSTSSLTIPHFTREQLRNAQLASYKIVDKEGKVLFGPNQKQATPKQATPKSNEFSTRIVGGDDVSTTTDCQGTSTSVVSTIETSTVAVVFPLTAGSAVLCTGIVVADDLILTAGHCFNDVSSSATSPGYVSFGNVYDSDSVDISCWQRNSNYCDDSTSASCVLNDIAWVKVPTGTTSEMGFSPVTILSNPQNISTTEEKVMAGFGLLNDDVSNSSGVRRCVSTYAGSTSIYNYAAYGDQLPSGAISTFNTAVSSTDAYENYLTVIGPIMGSAPDEGSSDDSSSSAKGSCNGDSGGPVYVKRDSNWILVALTQGSNSILSPMPTYVGSAPYSSFTFSSTEASDCAHGYGVYTTVGGYVSWIESTSGVTVTTY
jgi:hypothetical protein